MPHDLQAHREKARAAFSSVLWSLFLTGIKIWAGMATNSLGILSEALHSGLDFCAAAITFYAVKVAAIPPDTGHPYGHEKVENLSALVEVVLLVATCVWIVWEALNRLFYGAGEINLTWWAFAVVAISLVVDVNRSAMLRRVAKKHKSQALEADALHFTTDIWSSAVVLLGLVCVWATRFINPGNAWHGILLKADSVAALFVAGLILHVSWGLSKRAVHALMDGSSAETAQAVKALLQEKMPSYPVQQLRLRESGSKAYAEVSLAIPSHLHADDAHALCERVEELVREVIPDAETIVHPEPVDFIQTHSDDELARHIALRYDISIHAFLLIPTKRGRLLYVDIELPPNQTLEDAGPQISQFRDELGRALALYKLVIRIEPLSRGSLFYNKDRSRAWDVDAIKKEIGMTVSGISGSAQLESIDCDDLVETGCLTVYCTAPPRQTVTECHHQASDMEHKLHHALPDVTRITVVIAPKPEGGEQDRG